MSKILFTDPESDEAVNCLYELTLLTDELLCEDSPARRVFLGEAIDHKLEEYFGPKWFNPVDKDTDTIHNQ